MAKLTLNEDTFETEVEKSDVPVMVDFWAPWCGPCRVQRPIIEELAEDFKDKKIKIAELNVDEARATAQKYGILSIPTLVIFRDGKPIEQMVGLQTKPILEEKLKAL